MSVLTDLRMSLEVPKCMEKLDAFHCNWISCDYVILLHPLCTIYSDFLEM